MSIFILKITQQLGSFIKQQSFQKQVIIQNKSQLTFQFIFAIENSNQHYTFFFKSPIVKANLSNVINSISSPGSNLGAIYQMMLLKEYRKAMPTSKKPKYCKNKSGEEQQKLIRLLDFKIQEGKRRYKGEWNTANNKIITKWTNLKDLKNYHLAICCYQSYQKDYIKLHEQAWRNMIDSGEALVPLQNFHVDQNLFYRYKKGIQQQKDEQDSKDSDFIFGKKKRIKKCLNKIQKTKNIPSSKKPKQSNKSYNHHPIKKIERKIERKIEKYQAIKKDDLPQTPKIVLRQKKDNTQIGKESWKIQRKNNEKVRIELSPKQADKSTGQPFSPYSLNDSEQNVILISSGKNQSNCLLLQHSINQSIENHKPKQSPQKILQISSSNQELQNANMSKGKRIYGFDSQCSKAESNNQLSYVYQPQPSVDFQLNFNQLKQLIKLNLDFPSNDIKLHQQAKIEQRDEWKNDIKISQRQQLKMQIKIEQKIEQNYSLLDYNQNENLKAKSDFQELFRCYFQDRFVKDQKEMDKIYEIKAIYSLENTQFFEVNIGNSYYEQLRFISYQTIKQKHSKLLIKWLKSQNPRTKN